MPTYQYACTECGHDLEAVQSFTDEALTECPVCHGRLRKVFGNVGIVFKGSGFYRNDSRDKKPAAVGAKTDGKVDAGSDSTSGATESTKSDVPAGSSKTTNGKDAGASKPAAATSSTSSTKGSAA